MTVPVGPPPSGPVSVTWAAPPECPSGASVERAVGALLATSSRATDASAHVDVRVTVRRSRDPREGRYSALVETRAEGIEGTRTFHAATCASIADATALLLGLMIDRAVAGATAAAPGLVFPPLASPQPSPWAIAAPGRPAPVAASARARPASTSTTWRFAPRLEAAVAFDVGTLPRAATGVEVGAGVEYGPLLLDLEVGLWPGSVWPDGEGGSITLATGQLSLCGRPLSRLPVWACGGQSWVHLSGTFLNEVDTAPHQTGDTAALVGGVFAEPRLGPIGLILRAEGVLFYRRPELLGESRASLFTPAPAAFRGFVGLALHFL